MNPGPPQGDTNYCWAAAVVSAAHHLGYNVEQSRSESGVSDLVEVLKGTRGVKPLAKNGTGGINRVIELATLLGVKATRAGRQTISSVKGFVAQGACPVVMWVPRDIGDEDWFGGLHAGAILRWDSEVYVSDSFADDCGSTATLRVFRPPNWLWFRPTVAVLRR